MFVSLSIWEEFVGGTPFATAIAKGVPPTKRKHTRGHSCATRGDPVTRYRWQVMSVESKLLSVQVVPVVRVARVVRVVRVYCVLGWKAHHGLSAATGMPGIPSVGGQFDLSAPPTRHTTQHIIHHSHGCGYTGDYWLVRSILYLGCLQWDNDKHRIVDVLHRNISKIRRNSMAQCTLALLEGNQNMNSF